MGLSRVRLQRGLIGAMSRVTRTVLGLAVGIQVRQCISRDRHATGVIGRVRPLAARAARRRVDPTAAMTRHGGRPERGRSWAVCSIRRLDIHGRISTMSTQWQNFLKNRGEWRGSFASLNIDGDIINSTPSILNLDSSEDDTVVHFRLRRFTDGGDASAPTQDHSQQYRSLGKQVVFFESGAFSKGSLQVAPCTRFGAEYGFVAQDRRARLVQLFTEAGQFDSLVLIREFRAGSDARERPALEPDQLIGTWRGEAATITAEWPEPTLHSSVTTMALEPTGALAIRSEWGEETMELEGRIDGRRIALGGDAPGLINLLPDGGFSHVPLRVDHRHAFFVQAGWLVSPDQFQRLIRRYNDRGEWLSSTHLIETRAER
jgi:hypothetical protein